MPTPAPSALLEVCLNRALTQGNPLCTSATNLSALDHIEAIVGDLRQLRIRFLDPSGVFLSAPLSSQLQAGAAMVFAGKAIANLAASALLFRVINFTEGSDDAGYYYDGQLNLTDAGLQSAVGSSAITGLLCLVDVEVTTPAAGGTPATRKTFRINATILPEVYRGGESLPTIATPGSSLFDLTLSKALSADPASPDPDALDAIPTALISRAPAAPGGPIAMRFYFDVAAGTPRQALLFPATPDDATDLPAGRLRPIDWSAAAPVIWIYKF